MGGQTSSEEQSPPVSQAEDNPPHHTDGSSSRNVPVPKRIQTDTRSESASSSPSTPSSLTDRVQRLVGSRPPDGGSKRQDDILTSQPIETVPTAFKWSYGGERVFVTGSFNNWQGKIKMHPNEDNPEEFVLIIDIPPGYHEYKFIVDDEWRLNPNSPITPEKPGVPVNNIVEVKRPVFEVNSSSDVPYDDSDDDLDEMKRKITYGQSIPSSEEYTSLPQKVPPQLLPQTLCLNAPPNKVDPYVLPVPLHVTLNHLLLATSGVPAGSTQVADEEDSAEGGENPNNNSNPKDGTASGAPPGTTAGGWVEAALAGQDDKVLVTAITQRFKTKAHISVTPKFVTLVYYRPKPKSTLPGLSLPGSAGSSGPSGSSGPTRQNTAQ